MMDMRLKNFIQEKPNESKNFHLFLYPDHDGVTQGGGRPGASEGPERILESLLKMTPPLEKKITHNPPLILRSMGSHIRQNLKIQDRHHQIQKELSKLNLKKDYLIGIGGGHDYAYPDISSFLKQFTQKNKSKDSIKPLVVNFDAHFDVRPLTHGITSGTAFFRLLEEFPNQFDFCQIGIQKHCNSYDHLNYLKMKKIPIVYNDQLHLVKKVNILNQKNRPCFISIDIDVFSSALAPGCSQSWPSGIGFTEFQKIFHFLLRSNNVRGIGVYEVAPPLDVHPLHTSRLAALILHTFIFNKYE